jgi:hypothetical protein
MINAAPIAEHAMNGASWPHSPISAQGLKRPMFRFLRFYHPSQRSNQPVGPHI